MCGIIGIFNNPEAVIIVKKGLEVMKNRGLDASNINAINAHALGHNLHAIVDTVIQPLKYEGSYLIYNGEIYNWESLAEKHGLQVKNDAELLLQLLSKEGIKDIQNVLGMLKGVYAFCYYDTKIQKCIIARDLIGEKPLWYSFSSFFAVASEKKALAANGIFDAHELNPRTILTYDVKNNAIASEIREFFSIKETKEGLESIKQKMTLLLTNAIKMRIPGKKFGLLFSGGLDSVYLAYILKRLGADVVCYTAIYEDTGMQDAADRRLAEKAAELLGVQLKIITKNTSATEEGIKSIIPLIEATDVTKVGIALPIYFAAEQAHKDGCKVVLAGLGAEEIFGGHERHKGSEVNKECLSNLRKLYERDLYRDDVVTMAHALELRNPFLDVDVVAYALSIPSKYKTTKTATKAIFREIAQEIGIPDELTISKKKSPQYSSGFDKAIGKLAKAKKLNKTEYLNGFSTEHNLKLGVLWSSGKDSAYAAYLMQKHNYDLSCLLTMQSKNPYSFMFHTPNVSMARLQATAAGIPLIIQQTQGQKEEEIDDLVLLMKKAKAKYGIQGIVTGALFSVYQRDRIEKAADALGLKIFSPLWHKDQEQELREILESGCTVVLSSIAAEGLDASWLGKPLTKEHIEKLVALKKKIGLNPAGEGGEYESLVLDCPLFKKRIQIKKSRIVKESETNAFFVVEKAVLAEKGKNLGS